VPAAARLAVDVRAETAAEQERIDAAVRALRPALPGARLEVAGGIDRPPLEPALSAALFALAGYVAAALGLDPPGSAHVGGASDGNITAALGVSTLDGLGAVGANAHAEGEFVVLDELPRRAALLAGLITGL
jgi:glutamate carboxypeptidase